MLATEVILGRPGSGKTYRVMELLNAYRGRALLVSLENPAGLLRSNGIKESVFILNIDSCNLTTDSIIAACRKIGAGFVAIDNLELLPEIVLIKDLQERLAEIGVEKFVITSHLRRDLKSASSERINQLNCTLTILKPPQILRLYKNYEIFRTGRLT